MSSGEDRAHCGPAPRGLKVKGWPSRAQRVNRADGWTDIEVFALTGSSPTDKDPLGVDYIFGLHTTPGYLDHDLRVFRHVLAGSRIWRTTVPWTPFGADP